MDFLFSYFLNYVVLTSNDECLARADMALWSSCLEPEEFNQLCGPSNAGLASRVHGIKACRKSYAFYRVILQIHCRGS